MWNAVFYGITAGTAASHLVQAFLDTAHMGTHVLIVSWGLLLILYHRQIQNAPRSS